ncbi:MAG: hypothetical protein IK048_00055 [Clostridia bacterium]|nr:hypothetical protein [Clostridia bacterium]
MTEQYTQIVEIPTTNRDKAKLIAGIAFVLASLAFLIVGILKSKFFLIGFGVLFMAGFVLIQAFESAASEYVYSISPKSFAVSKKNNAHNTKRIAILNLEKVIRVERFCDVVSKGDIIACENSGARDVFALVYEKERRIDDETTKYGRLLLTPDDYMLALFNENFGDKPIIEAEN